MSTAATDTVLSAPPAAEADSHGGEQHTFHADVGRVLHLMIHSLYTNRDIFLRELISNASDACDKLRYEAITRPELLKEDTALRIAVAVDAKANTLTITDNGIGMTREELARNLGTIARSGTAEFLQHLGEAGADAPTASAALPELIGQFGVGFYSAFMVAERVTVTSRKAGETQGWVWESEGQGAFTLRPAGADTPRGTRILLHLREGKDYAPYVDQWRLKHIISTYSDHVSWPITLAYESDNRTGVMEPVTEQVNTAAALWTRPKADITPEQYAEFYHAVAHQPDEPWLTLHNRVEGRVEYTYLLFIPTRRPFDLFHPDRRRRVKLYVKRVFITEDNVDLVPHWLRFVRGVVDSQDLPLNVSRETLQNNQVVGAIRDSITKRLLSELKKKAEQDPAGYAAFWAQYGPVLKEGLCEAMPDKTPLLEVCRFHSTATDVGPEGWTGLDQYIARMRPEQDAMYYLSGENAAQMAKSPAIEGLVSRGIEVLLFTDTVDDFWSSVVPEFKGKPLRSATKGEIDLSAYGAPPAAEGASGTALATSADDISALVAAFKAALGEAVEDVRPTSRLTESPVCLAVPEHGMDLRMERYLVENRQLPGTYAKVLEINPTHPIIRRAAETLRQSTQGQDAPELTRLAHLLLDQARILAGEPPADPVAFARHLNSVLAAD